VTGITLGIDHTELTDAEFDRTFQIKKQTAGLPASIVLDRVLMNVAGKELRWVENPPFKTITTAEKAATIQRVSTLEIGPLLDGGYSATDLRRLVMEYSSGPWHETDGQGGSIRVLGDRMTIRQTDEGIREAQVILTALGAKEPVIDLFSAPADERVRDALSKNVTGEFDEVPLSVVMEKLTRQVGLIADFDTKALAEAGTGGDVQVSLNVRNSPLKTALDKVLEEVGGVQLATLVRHGVLVVTTYEDWEQAEAVRIYDIPEVAERGDTQALITLIQEMTPGPWKEIDGVGGTIESPRPRTLIIRQSETLLKDVEQLIVAHRGGKTRAKPAGEAFEVKRYRLSTKTAEGLAGLIPRFVEPEQWVTYREGSLPTIECISTDLDSILLIRQTPAIHAKIDQFINELLKTPPFQQPPAL
jgi:hypothetical protein